MNSEAARKLRSDAPLVLIEAPAGCGKTFEAATYAQFATSRIGTRKVLVLTHTHAACSVISSRTTHIRNRVDIRTLDSLVFEIASAYRVSLGLPENIAGWARRESDGYTRLAARVSVFLQANPMVSDVLADRFPIIICDEHQDSNPDHESIVKCIGQSGAKLRIFGDPMQVILGGTRQDVAVKAVWDRWNQLRSEAVYGKLDTPHRWRDTNPSLGEWILEARELLKQGAAVDISGELPDGIQVLDGENQAAGRKYQLAPARNDWSQINSVINTDSTLLCVAGQTDTVSGLRSTFKSRLPIWEGHTRPALEGFVNALSTQPSLVDAMNSFIEFLKSVLTGFTANFSRRLVKEFKDPTANPKGVIPPHMKTMAEFVQSESNHVGFARAAEHLRLLIRGSEGPFSKIRIDFPWELNDLIELQSFADAEDGLAEISHRRSRAHPQPPRKCLSTIHKSKGLEAETVVIFALDKKHFSDSLSKRNLLYVAMSRATTRLVIMASRSEQSPLVRCRP